MINRVVLTGRLTKDVDLKSTRSGVSVASFTLAVDRRYTDSQGNRGADFISCVAWRKAAENMSKYFHKGSLVGIDGSLQTRTYDDKDGKRVYVTEVVVSDFSFLEPKKGSNKQSNYNQSYSSQKSKNQQTEDPFQGQKDSIDITDDDLPF